MWRTLLAITAVCVAVVSCQRHPTAVAPDRPDSSETTPPPPEPSVPDINTPRAQPRFHPWQFCNQDDDCEAVQAGCCDHCNGGFVIAVHRNHADDALRAYKPSDCSGPCTLKSCAGPEPICRAGDCGYVAGWKFEVDASGNGTPVEVVEPLPRPSKYPDAYDQAWTSGPTR